MAIRNLTELKGILPRGGRLMGLDLGEKTLGLAVSDPGLTVASPVDIIRRQKFTQDVQALAKACQGRGIGAFVLGLPMNMDGSAGKATDKVREFARQLGKQAAVLGFEPEIAFWDERLSTSAVSRLMIDFDMTRKRRGEVVDKMAAAYILQGALDFLARQPPQAPS